MTGTACFRASLEHVAVNGSGGGARHLGLRQSVAASRRMMAWNWTAPRFWNSATSVEIWTSRRRLASSKPTWRATAGCTAMVGAARAPAPGRSTAPTPQRQQAAHSGSPKRGSSSLWRCQQPSRRLLGRQHRPSGRPARPDRHHSPRPRAGLQRAAVLSDGATRLVDRFGLLVAELPGRPGRAGTRRDHRPDPSDPRPATRTGDGRWPRGKRHDDASAAFCHLV